MEKIKINFSKSVADDRRQIVGLLTDAIDKQIEPEEDFNDSIRRISEYYENMTGYYPVISLSKDDIREVGYNPDELGPGDMRNFANHMPEENIMESYWVSLKYCIENNCQLPKLYTETDKIYEEYKQEQGSEPLYAEIWLEDKDYENLPRLVTVKLSLDVDEQEDEQVYMYFQGYADLKKWLYSTMEEDSNSEDIWCYDSPEQRIVFMDKLFVDEI